MVSKKINFENSTKIKNKRNENKRKSQSLDRDKNNTSFEKNKSTLPEKKNNLILPKIPTSTINMKKKELKFSNIITERQKMSLSNTKIKIKTAFINNEEEELIKRNKF